MPTMITTHESTLNVPTDRAVRDVGRGIAYVNPDAAPLITITRARKEGDRTASNDKVEWIEKDMLSPRFDQADGATTTGETTLDVDNGSFFQANDIVRVIPTGELVRVTSIATNALTVVRSVGDASGTAAATIADNADLEILGSAFAQGADVRAPRSHQETYKFNVMQIARTSFGTTNTEAWQENYTGPDRPRQRKEALVNHKVDLERVLISGERSDNLGSTDAPAYTAGGLLYFLTSNSKDASGTLTEPEIEDWVEDLFFTAQGGSKSKLWVVSPLIASVVDQLAAARLMTAPKEETFGVAIRQFVTSHGNLNMVTHPLLVNGAGGAGYAGYSFGLDMGRIRYVKAPSRDTQLLPNRQGNGEDKWTDEYLSEFSWEIKNPEYHGKLYGVTG